MEASDCGWGEKTSDGAIGSLLVVNTCYHFRICVTALYGSILRDWACTQMNYPYLFTVEYGRRSSELRAYSSAIAYQKFYYNFIYILIYHQLPFNNKALSYISYA